MSTYHIWTIGCQMNASDSLRLAERLEQLGYRRTERLEDADVMVLNTCVVRGSAENKVVGRLSSLKPVKRRRPNSVLALMGCFVGQNDPGLPLEQQYPFVDVFLRPSEPDPLLDLLRDRQQSGARVVANGEPDPAPVCAYSTIMQGCNNFCSYCIVPYTRGRERSRPLPEVVAEVRGLVSRGAREITLLGQNVDSYGRTLPDDPTLADLLVAVHEIEDLWRIRFLTSHPKDMTGRLIETVARLPKVCEHIELPVQAGDDEVLRQMNRRYTVAHYRDLVSRIREAIPGVSLATDVVVGFPGETVEQFENTYRLLEDIRFDAVHVAGYSPRAGTAASRLADDVPLEEKERRRCVVEALQERIIGEINDALLGQTVEVLVEDQHKGKWGGRTRTNKLVFFTDSGDWRGRLAQVRITWAGPWSMQGAPSHRDTAVSSLLNTSDSVGLG
jgi:tRNA-2-methylthio-N6-dimethylallyladenosine synthase